MPHQFEPPASSSRKVRSGALRQFIIRNRDAIIAEARRRAARRSSPGAANDEETNGIPAFLTQLAEALRPSAPGDDQTYDAIEESATLHAHELLRMGVSVAQVVHDYGDVCQAVTTLAIGQSATISADDFRRLNLCLDDAIASAVTEYSRLRERSLVEEETERLGSFTHELRNALNAAVLSFEVIKGGVVGPAGSTSALHERSLSRMRSLVERSLTQVRVDSRAPRLEVVAVAQFIEELEIDAAIQARQRGRHLTVGPVDPSVRVAADRQTLESALSNLLGNAFKFTREGGSVSLVTRVTADRVMFEVADECGGLPPGTAEELFRPFEQRSRDRTGLGLGLGIARRAVKANGGEMRVEDHPGEGCVFTVDLPRPERMGDRKGPPMHVVPLR